MDATIVERLNAQWAGLLVLIERPAVQRQLLTILFLLLITRLFTFLFRYLSRRLAALSRDGQARSRAAALGRWLRMGEGVASPLFAVAIGLAAIALFERIGWTSGLLRQGLVLFWLFLGYRFTLLLLDLRTSSEESRRAYRRILTPLFAFLLLAVINRLVASLVDVAGLALFTIADNPVTVADVYRAGFILYGFLAGGWLVQRLFTRHLLPRLDADPGVGNSIRTISQYVIVGAGVLTSLGSLGIDLSTLAIIGAGLSVGIGFGLQELVANFISGILLLFEQSIRPGDVISVNGTVGRVEKLRIRSTTVRTNENIELIVPNQSLLTAAVTTYTHTDRSVRIHVPVGVSYDTDPAEVREVLLAAARRHGLVRETPPPTVFFQGYGDSSIDFTLAVWIDDFMNMPRVTSDLRFIIWEELAKRNIEIPFPQRDLHLRSGVPWEDLLRKRSE